MINKIVRVVTITAGLAVPIAADAAPLLFTLEGSRNATFQLDSNPVPDSFTSLQTNFNDVPGTFGGTETVASLINFGRSDGIFTAAALNILAPGLGFTQFSGDLLFTGTTAAPIFTVGVYQLNNPFFGGPATLTISAVAGGGGTGNTVPEPSTWAMLVVGFGLVGVTVRRRKATTVAA